MRRGVDMRAVAGRFETRADHCHRRPFALGAGDMHYRRKPVLRVAERGEQPLDTLERQVNKLRVQTAEPLEHPIARLCGHEALSVSDPAIADGCGSRKSPRMRPNVACKSARGTTRSTMP